MDTDVVGTVAFIQAGQPSMEIAAVATGGLYVKLPIPIHRVMANDASSPTTAP